MIKKIKTYNLGSLDVSWIRNAKRKKGRSGRDEKKSGNENAINGLWRRQRNGLGGKGIVLHIVKRIRNRMRRSRKNAIREVKREGEKKRGGGKEERERERKTLVGNTRSCVHVYVGFCYFFSLSLDKYHFIFILVYLSIFYWDSFHCD